jgi:TrmH family RNA methyltransferase
MAITSFSNPLVKRIKRLRQRKHRQEEGAFFVEGLRVVLTALERGAPVECLVFAPELLSSPAARAAVAAFAGPIHELAPAVFGSISERDNPAGLGAIVQSGAVELDDLPIGQGSVLLALEEVSDPGNLGTILRTADAAGVRGIILAGTTTDPYHPTAVKASMGTLFTVPVSRVGTMAELLEWAGRRDLMTVATSAKAPTLYWQARYRRPLVLLMGSEREGLGPEVLEAADLAVTIPMRGAASSLNIAVATALLLYEIERQVR